jgi:hypothetical protein
MFLRPSILSVTETIQVHEGRDNILEGRMLTSPDLHEYLTIRNITSCDYPTISCPAPEELGMHVSDTHSHIS